MRLLPFEISVRNLQRSPRRALAIAAGSMVIVLLLVAASAFVRGMNGSLSGSGDAGNVLLLGAGSEESLERSQISAAVPGLVSAAIDGIPERLGRPYVSPELHVALPIRVSTGGETQLLLRGFTPAALLVHPQVQVIEGRAPRAGRDELMVGRQVRVRLGVEAPEIAPGSTLRFADRTWTISGVFAAPGTVMESELWAPLTDVQVATKNDGLSCVVLTLGSAEFADVDVFCKQRLDLELVAMPEADYYARQREFFAPIQAVVFLTACLIALGGLFGGLNALYAAFVARVREFGTLQAIGFSRLAILVSLLQEALIASAAGALTAAGVALLVLDGRAVSFSMGSFALRVDGAALLLGLSAGLVLGVIGTLPPAWRCLRLPIKDAVRAI